jgi:hypothetical protein
MWTPVLVMALLSVESAGTDVPRQLGLDIDPQVMLGIGEFCEQGGDTIGCSPAWGAVGVRAAIGWLPNPAFSVGAGGGYFWLPNDSMGFDGGTTTTFPKRMRQIFATGKLFLGPGAWVETDLGLATLIDGIRMTGAIESSTSVSQSGPLMGLRVGYDWRVNRYLGFGVGGGAVLTLLPATGPADARGDRHNYGNPVWIGLLGRTSFGY